MIVSVEQMETAFLVFLATAAGTSIVATDLCSDPIDRFHFTTLRAKEGILEGQNQMHVSFASGESATALQVCEKFSYQLGDQRLKFLGEGE